MSEVIVKAMSDLTSNVSFGGGGGGGGGDWGGGGTKSKKAKEKAVENAISPTTRAAACIVTVGAAL